MHIKSSWLKALNVCLASEQEHKQRTLAKDDALIEELGKTNCNTF